MKPNEIKVEESYWWNGRFRERGEAAVEPQLVRVIDIDDSGYLPVTIKDEDGDICHVDLETFTSICTTQDMGFMVVDKDGEGICYLSDATFFLRRIGNIYEKEE